jgi:PAS domain S-box-containing protein
MRILVADDDEASRLLLDTLFSAKGYEVVLAKDGEEALEKARALTVDAIVSDILMPRMDGYRLCMECKKDERLAGAPFVFYTASYTDPEDRRLAEHMGADRFLLKPMEPEALLGEVESAIGEVAEREPVAPEATLAGDAETLVLDEYSGRLVRKLEEKVTQLKRDIAERTRIEADLRRERDFTSQVIEVADLLICGLDSEGTIELYSRGAERITGYAAPEAIGRDFLDLLVPEHARGRYEKQFENIQSGLYPLRMTGVIRTRSGRERTLDWSHTVRTDESGRVDGVLTFGLDVTQRVRAEVCDAVVAKLNNAVLMEESFDDALLDLCVRLTQALHLQMVAVAVRTPGGRLELRSSAGPAASADFDLFMSEATGFPTAVTRALESSESVLDTVEDMPPELRMVSREVSVDAIFAVPLAAFGQVMGAVAFCARDASSFDDQLVSMLERCVERIGLTFALSENQRRMQLQSTALTSAANAILITDADGHILWANRAYELLSGYSLEEMRGRKLPLLLRLIGTVPDPMEELRQGRTWHGEVVSTRKNTEEYSEEVTLAPVLKMDGTLESIVAVKQDITDRKRLEQAKTDFLSMISHELRTPLTSIIAFTDLLLARREDADAEQAQLFAEKIRFHGGEMQRLVEELLEVSQLESGKFPLDVRSCLVGPLVREYAESVSMGPDHELVLDIQKDLPEVACDPERVGSLVSNLVSNAVKYSPDGGKVALGLSSDGRALVLTVSDEGIGIEPDAIGSVFDRFTQADMSATRSFGGFGLGLFIVREIAHAHGGQVSVESTPGEGSTFTVTLPVKGPPEPRADGLSP